MSNDYVPPKVWTWDQANGGQFANINRPTAGATHDKALPVGAHPLQLYSLATPNGVKVTILLEELLEAGHDAEYDAWLIDIGKGDQFGSGFVEVNPNSKIPALMDHSVTPPQRVFESASIMLYLAEKFGGAFIPKDPRARTEMFSWLFWQMGSAPFVGGGFGHFYAYAPSKMEYPINRYAMETKRQLDVLDRHLAEHDWMSGDYSLADMAIYAWYGNLVLGRAYDAAEFLDVTSYTHVLAWAQKIDARPAVIRGRKVNRSWGEAHEQLPERHSASDFD
ncbi:glutathione-dependent disulfide-bond oxidoreductase [Tabrizicola sp.]|uniref:glutathione-dependent disulfide-bond oxidoreductase n=1 Tax=Tabrizicola sp. TaxID=2005166 RepID=UPI0026164E9B|nr:glutathione-dependent disulfide-bond oxidoreductase [Tabrizicola sp.]MDM7933368.1 glutathione-dependent disulfide-bond oxidoreductase [Tabrizicola sp.]